jgi:hypothetical protein
MTPGDSHIRVRDGHGTIIAYIDPVTRVRTNVDGTSVTHALQDIEIFKKYSKKSLRHTMPAAVIHTKAKEMAAGNLRPTVMLSKR